MIPVDPFRVDDALLAQCAAERIHVPGSVQSHGTLLALSSQFVVEQAAGRALGGVPAHALPGRALSYVVTSTLAETVRGAVPTLRTGVPRDLGTYPIAEDVYEAVLHRHEGRLILELVQSGTRAPGLTPALDSGVAVAEVLDLLATGETVDMPLATACQLVADQFREFSGYDRVLIYRFDADWNGEVVAEACAEGDGRFAGLWFPASDIPPQARDVYLRSRLRVLADVTAEPVPLHPTTPGGGQALDLTHALLRAGSPIHREYLGNMGVRATLVVSVIIAGRLWGLISCHHGAPRIPDAATRALGHGLATTLGSLAQAHDLRERQLGEQWAHAFLDTLRTRVLSMQDLGTAMVAPEARFMEMVGADGLAVVVPNGLHTRGNVPDPASLDALVGWLDERVGGFLLTDHLAAEAPACDDLLPTAAGLMALRIPGFTRAWVLWFRAETAHTVHWGGDPRKGIVSDNGAARLSPRTSFDAWRQTVVGHSRPWSIAERAMASEAVRANLLDVVVAWQRRHVEALEAHYSYLLSQVRDAIIVLDLRGVVTFWSAGASEIFAAPASDRLGRGFEAALPEAVRAALAPQLTAVRNGAAASLEVEFDRPDGTSVWLDIRVNRVLDAEGRATALVIVARDATSRRDLESQLRQAAKMEAVGGLAGGIAHDFNNLLTVVNGFSSLVLKSLPEEAPTRWMVQEIANVGERGTALTQQMLAFSRRQLLKPETFDLNRAVHGCGRMLERLIGEDVRIEYALADGPCLVHADPGQVDQVLMNLAVNARDAMPSGGLLRVRTAVVRHDGGAAPGLAALPAGTYASLAVEDTGVGMSAATLTKIFDPFFTTKDPGKGTGLGLAVVYGVVNQSQGYIGVQTTPGAGTTFRVYLPSVGAEGTDGAVSVELVPVASRGETILVVEDEAGVRSLTCLLLREHGYRVIEAAHPGEALELAALAPRLDLLLTDVVMPEMQGPEIAERLVAARPGLRVLFMSGYPGDEMLRRGVSADGAAFLSKPFQPATLLSRVRALLDAAPVNDR
jgi:PAS domain S-box-containing protein